MTEIEWLKARLLETGLHEIAAPIAAHLEAYRELAFYAGEDNLAALEHAADETHDALLAAIREQQMPEQGRGS